MRSRFLILCLALYSNAYSQIDTLTLNFGDTYHDVLELIASLPKTKARRVSIDLNTYRMHYAPHDPVSNGYVLTRKSKRLFKKAMDCLNERLAEVKVLYVLNPTGFSDYITLSEEVLVDTTIAPVFQLNFAKLTSLTTVYLLGDDDDSIRDMPSAFYTTPVKRIYCCCLFNYSIFVSNVKRRNPGIEIIKDEPEASGAYLDFIQMRL